MKRLVSFIFPININSVLSPSALSTNCDSEPLSGVKIGLKFVAVIKEFLIRITTSVILICGTVADSVAVDLSNIDYDKCWSEGMWSLDINQKRTQQWKIKKGAFCQHSFGASKYYFLAPIEIISLPPGCKGATRKTDIAITCQQPGQYVMRYRLHIKQGSVVGVIDFDANITVYE